MQSRIPLIRSFQAVSYVQDDLPLILFHRENRNGNLPRLQLPRQTATVTEHPNTMVNSYFDEHDTDEGLTKIEERMKIFYENRPSMVPIFTQLDIDEAARKKQNRLFKYFKTQRANSVL